MKKSISKFSVIFISLVLCCVSIAQFSGVTSFILDGYTFSVTSAGTASLRGWDYSTDELVVPNMIGDMYVSEIADYAFREDEKIKALNLDNAKRLTRIGTSSFAYSGVSGSFSIPSGVTYLGDSAFEGCSGIVNVEIKSKSLSLPSQFFKECINLKEVTIYNGIETIESYAFKNCSSLSTITIPRSVNSINSTAFNGCGEFTIKCYKDSYAVQYAKDNGISYEILDPLYGDANDDGDVNILDVTFIQKYKIGIKEFSSDFAMKCADVNKSGDVTIRDATLIQMKIAKIIENF